MIDDPDYASPESLRFLRLLANANFGPLMAGVALAGGAMSAMGTLAGGASAASMGRASAGEATFEAAQDRMNAGADVAASQLRMQQTQFKTNQLTGTATAR